MLHQTNYLQTEKWIYLLQTVFIWSFFSEKPKTRTDKSAIQIFYSIWKETNHKPSKVALQKCIDKCFWFHVITGWHSFFIKAYCYPEVHFNRRVLAFLEKRWLERSPYFIFYLQNASAMLIPVPNWTSRIWTLTKKIENLTNLKLLLKVTGVFKTLPNICDRGILEK